ncbi:MAG: hypothetical protein ACREEG_02740 [Phenylobacterium sp.]
MAIAVSVLAHVLFVAWLAWRLGLAPVLQDMPVINVELAKIPHAKPKPDKTSEPPAKGSTRAATDVIPAERPVPVPPGPTLVGPGPEAVDRGDNVRKALRGLRNCDLVRLPALSVEERERCEDRLAAAGSGTGPVRFNLDPRGAFAGGAEPYLARHPTHGCKPRASGGVEWHALHDQSPAASVACALAF